MTSAARHFGIGVSNEPRPKNWTIYYVLGIPTVVLLFGALGVAVWKLWT